MQDIFILEDLHCIRQESVSHLKLFSEKLICIFFRENYVLFIFLFM